MANHPRTIRKSSSQYFDPCQEAANRSIRCLNRNAGDRTMCSDYFQWVSIFWNGARVADWLW
ncbi:unnamed protein product [Tuber melanosporum]|uniref:(Perigord truffle) hypothetical protein n=1 Tax=Tuber melanosporum (strain Mel28) TaxID=656061 RepID=D5G5M4_TUBMM|nr:uncharacterized protein GSTUM_00001487001 [Tuber melanosporum]CAZ79817.1 unnamed protein product [Tuber melanosporum]